MRKSVGEHGESEAADSPKTQKTSASSKMSKQSRQSKQAKPPKPPKPQKPPRIRRRYDTFELEDTEVIRAARRNKRSLLYFVEQVYMPHARLSKRSWRTDFRSIGQHILPSFACMEFERISTGDVERWMDQLTLQYAPATCNRLLSVLKALCNLAVRRGLITKVNDPCINVRYLRNVRFKERFLSASEAGRLMNALCRDNSKEALALRLLMLTGARKSEILGARWENVHLERHTLCVPLSKSGKTRFIYLSDAAVELFRELRERNTEASPWVFPSKCVKKPVQDIYPYWKKLRTDLKMPELRIHDLRHTFASFLVNSGHTLYEVQKLLGHSDPRITMRYAHLDSSELISAAEDVSRLIHASAEAEAEGSPSSAQKGKLETSKEPREAKKPRKSRKPGRPGKSQEPQEPEAPQEPKEPA